MLQLLLIASLLLVFLELKFPVFLKRRHYETENEEKHMTFDLADMRVRNTCHFRTKGKQLTDTLSFSKGCYHLGTSLIAGFLYSDYIQIKGVGGCPILLRIWIEENKNYVKVEVIRGSIFSMNGKVSPGEEIMIKKNDVFNLADIRIYCRGWR